MSVGITACCLNCDFNSNSGFKFFLKSDDLT
jgi:hypothetical protein